MTFADWLEETRTRFQTMGLKRGAVASANEFWVGMLRRFGRDVWNYGEPIYERDWDVLLVLDACRVDLMREVAAEERDRFPFLDPEFEVFDSAGSMSKEWMEKNFGDEYADEKANTAYVSGNPFTRDLDPDEFGLLDEVWRYAWDDERDLMPPRPLTDRAIQVKRDRDPDRLVVHYLQPHVPFRSMPDAGFRWGDPEENFGVKDGGTGEERGPWHRLLDGNLSRDELWEGYRDNLEWVLEDVELFLDNADADTVVISSDHANAMGEWWCYAHPDYVPIPALKRVPWIETSATDTGSYEPKLEVAGSRADDDSMDDDEVNDRLEALGYK
ncbi:alkaline phosphatase family protein [Halorussus salinisoli]|uniref:hypothetical protein n=1 Tax=Halorussus salinisoli TaxID=2558242 RepID=UPI0010C2422C|nr:hypothetical protein [Halorussus salinisoli]